MKEFAIGWRFDQAALPKMEQVTVRGETIWDDSKILEFLWQEAQKAVLPKLHRTGAPAVAKAAAANGRPVEPPLPEPPLPDDEYIDDLEELNFPREPPPPPLPRPATGQAIPPPLLDPDREQKHAVRLACRKLFEKAKLWEFGPGAPEGSDSLTLKQWQEYYEYLRLHIEHNLIKIFTDLVTKKPGIFTAQDKQTIKTITKLNDTELIRFGEVVDQANIPF